ncbi:MAG TPA: hypothetical protein DCE41_22635 [Cytophagales bacterium]|nr:hypothetical protein [Cytophagales bacterium]
MVVTMVLHPTGGNVEQILRVKTLAISAHSLALLSLPVLLLGLWGLKNRLSASPYLAQSGYLWASFGLFAVMISAATNGLVLPRFAAHLAEKPDFNGEVVHLISEYNWFVNQAYDFIFLLGMCGAIFCWSLAIWKTRMFPRWVAVFGFLLVAVALALFIGGVVLTDLHGFRFVILGLVVWLVVVGWQLGKAR